MRTSWKGISRVSDSGDPLLLVTVRSEIDLVVSAEQLEKFLSDLYKTGETKTIDQGSVDAVSLEFAEMKILLNSLRDASPDVAYAKLESPWKTFPLKEVASILPLLNDAFTSKAGFRIDGEAPNYTFVYHLGESSTPFPLSAPDIQTMASMFDAVNATSLQFGADQVIAGKLSIPEAVAITVGVAIVIPAVSYGVAVGIAAIAAGAVTAAQIEGYFLAAAAAAKLANEAYKLYLQREAAKRAADRAEEARLRREQQREEMKATRTWMISGGDDMTKVAGWV